MFSLTVPDNLQMENHASITSVQILQSLLAAVTLNRALLAVHFPSAAL
jgi:hypothetical protein